jgi:hypothetical protein
MSRHIICIDEELGTGRYHGLSQDSKPVSLFLENPKSNSILQTVKPPILQNEKCVKAFKNHTKIGATQLCAGGQVGHDSGGPLMKVDALDGPPHSICWVWCRLG